MNGAEEKVIYSRSSGGNTTVHYSGHQPVVNTTQASQQFRFIQAHPAPKWLRHSVVIIEPRWSGHGGLYSDPTLCLKLKKFVGSTAAFT